MPAVRMMDQLKAKVPLRTMRLLVMKRRQNPKMLPRKRKRKLRKARPTLVIRKRARFVLL